MYPLEFGNGARRPCQAIRLDGNVSKPSSARSDLRELGEQTLAGCALGLIGGPSLAVTESQQDPDCCDTLGRPRQPSSASPGFQHPPI